MTKTDKRWLVHDVAHLYTEFCAPDAELTFVRKLPRGNSLVLLPSGLQWTVPTRDLSRLPPAEQRANEALYR